MIHEIEKTRKILTAMFVGVVTATLLLVVLFECAVIEEGLLVGRSTTTEFAVTYLLELLTIALLPAALRLFKFKRIEDDLRQRHGLALRQWGVLRLSVIELLLVVNTILYYMYLNTSFGYLAIIVVLCMPLVWPSRQRCLDEAFANGDIRTEEES